MKRAKKPEIKKIYFFVFLKKIRGASMIFDFKEDIRDMMYDLGDDERVMDAGYFLRTSQDARERALLEMTYKDKELFSSRGISKDEIDKIMESPMMPGLLSMYADYSAYDTLFYIRVEYQDFNDGEPIKIVLPLVDYAEKSFIFMPK